MEQSRVQHGLWNDEAGIMSSILGRAISVCFVLVTDVLVILICFSESACMEIYV